MNIYDALKRDHQTVDKLLQQLQQKTGAAAKARADTFQKVKDELQLHTRLEEELFYARLEEADETAGLIDDARSDHEAVEELLAEMDDVEVGDDDWQQKLEDLVEDVKAHVAEEENVIFPAAKQVLDDAEAERIGKQFEEQKRQHA